MTIDAAELARLDGLFVGMLNEAELEAFEVAVKQGKARREYSGASGFMGLAKVRAIHTCDVCGDDAGNWRVIDETRWTIACPKCTADAEDADPSADRGDWEFHRDHDQ